MINDLEIQLQDDSLRLPINTHVYDDDVYVEIVGEDIFVIDVTYDMDDVNYEQLGINSDLIHFKKNTLVLHESKCFKIPRDYFRVILPIINNNRNNDLEMDVPNIVFNIVFRRISTTKPISQSWVMSIDVDASVDDESYEIHFRIKKEGD